MSNRFRWRSSIAHPPRSAKEMKKAAHRFIELIVLVFSLGYLTWASLNLFPKLLKTLPVEFIVYKPALHITMIQTAFWSAITISVLAVVIEWKREKRKVSYWVFLSYFTAPFVASLILILITASKIKNLPPMFAEQTPREVSTEIIPMGLVFIGYALFPVVHFALNKIKGQNQPELDNA